MFPPIYNIFFILISSGSKDPLWESSSVGQSNWLLTNRSQVQILSLSPLRGVAQLVEQRSPKPSVAGSNPAGPDTKNILEKIMTKIGKFFRESKAELKKVVWPTKEDVLSSIKVVIISTVIVAVILGLLDWGFTEAFRAIMK